MAMHALEAHSTVEGSHSTVFWGSADDGLIFAEEVAVKKVPHKKACLPRRRLGGQGPLFAKALEHHDDAVSSPVSTR